MEPTSQLSSPASGERASFRAALKIALRFLTRIPVRVSAEEDTFANRRLSTVLYPLAGGIIGILLILTRLFFSETVQYDNNGVFELIVWVALTGVLHLDGLMDVFDGFFYAGTAERRLEIMKDVHHGTYALAGTILFFLMKAQLIPIFFTPVLFFAPVYARWAALKIVRDEPVVNPNGMAAQLKKELHPKAVAYGAILPLLTLAGVAVLSLRYNSIIMYRGFNFHQKRSSLIGLLEIILMIFRLFVLWKLPGWLGKIARKTIGGINGDVLGAAIEISELIVLFLFTLHPPVFLMTDSFSFIYHL